MTIWLPTSLTDCKSSLAYCWDGMGKKKTSCFWIKEDFLFFAYTRFCNFLALSYVIFYFGKWNVNIKDNFLKLAKLTSLKQPSWYLYLCLIYRYFYKMPFSTNKTKYFRLRSPDDSDAVRSLRSALSERVRLADHCKFTPINQVRHTVKRSCFSDFHSWNNMQ